MPFALLLALDAIACGALVSYLYERDASVAARLCLGTCTGFAVLGLVGFVLASFLGMTPLALALAALIIAAPLLLLLKPEWRARVGADIAESASNLRRAIARPRSAEMWTLVFYAAVALLFWFLFGRAMFERAGEIYTGVDNNLGDLPFHISIITSFAHGDNFPPQDTEFAGVRLTYPFMVDFLTAMFVRAGASLQGAFFWQNFVLALSFVALLRRWALKLTRDRAASFITPAIVLLSGGFGWWRLLREWRAGDAPLTTFLLHLPHDYTIGGADGLYKWGNALTTLLIPQRGLLLGLPLALVVWTLWWEATADETEREELKGGRGKEGKRGKGKEREGRVDASARSGRGVENKKRSRRHETLSDETAQSSSVESGAGSSSWLSRFSLSPFPLLTFPLSPASRVRMMAGAGIVAGLLPLVHAHSFVVMMGMGGCLALLFREHWRAWAVFFGAALVVAVPQMLWATSGSAVHAETFFGWAFGWDSGEHNVVRFWLMNTGLFIPMLAAALLWRGGAPVVERRLLLFYLPFTLCFILPNLYKFSPNLWDNIKLLFYWWIASAPLVALLLARLWRERTLVAQVAMVVALVLLTLAGSLDVWRVVSEASEQREFERDGIAFAELIKRETPPRSLILHAPTYNHPVFLTGRRSMMGYAGHLWTHGLKYGDREAAVQRIYAGGFEADSLLYSHAVDYVVISPLEQYARLPVNEAFFKRYEKVGEVGAYRLYKTTRP